MESGSISTCELIGSSIPIAAYRSPSLPERLQRRTIANVACEAGLRGYAGITVYSATKGALVNLTRAMARELAPDVRVNCVCPGVIDTDMARARGAAALREDADYYYPMKRIGTAKEVAQAILYLASPLAGFVTGSALVIDGGATAGA
jgi:NAD(P)-dependent dehydrogenase (short-subunit alcohol dehydrogenase family)